MSQIFLYAEVQAAVPFQNAPWQKLNPAMKKQPGLIRKTWLSGLETDTIGGVYEFDTVQNARAYVDNYLAAEARAVGGPGSLMTRVYDGQVTEDASRDMQSPWLSPIGTPRAKGRVLLFNEMHWNVPFANVPWKQLNEQLKLQPGLLTKQWLSGVNTNTVNGLYEFANKEAALAFSFGMFAAECKKAGVTANVKLFDADVVEAASKDMSSPYFV